MALLCTWLQNGSQIQGYDTKFKHVCRLIQVYSTKFTNVKTIFNFQFFFICCMLWPARLATLPPTHPPVRPAFPPSAWPAEPIYINSRSTAKQLLLIPRTTKVAIPSVCAPFMLPFIWLSDTACTQISNFPAEENSRKKKQKMKMKNQKKQKMKMKKKKQKMTTHRDEDDGSEEPQEPEERFQKVPFWSRFWRQNLRSLYALYAHSTLILHTLHPLKLTLHSLYTPLQLKNKVPMQQLSNPCSQGSHWIFRAGPGS